MPCRLLLDRLSTPVSGSIIKVILSFPERILYLRGKKKQELSVHYVAKQYFARKVLKTQVCAFLKLS